MTTTVDQKHRAVIPFKPGDVLEIEQQSADVVVLKRTKPAKSAGPLDLRLQVIVPERKKFLLDTETVFCSDWLG